MNWSLYSRCKQNHFLSSGSQNWQKGNEVQLGLKPAGYEWLVTWPWESYSLDLINLSSHLGKMKLIMPSLLVAKIKLNEVCDCLALNVAHGPFFTNICFSSLSPHSTLFFIQGGDANLVFHKWFHSNHILGWTRRIKNEFLWLLVFLPFHLLIYFGHAAQLVGTQSPDQGLNPGHSSGSAES